MERNTLAASVFANSNIYAKTQFTSLGSKCIRSFPDDNKNT